MFCIRSIVHSLNSTVPLVHQETPNNVSLASEEEIKVRTEIKSTQT